jgi:hypothetical protein
LPGRGDRDVGLAAVEVRFDFDGVVPTDPADDAMGILYCKEAVENLKAANCNVDDDRGLKRKGKEDQTENELGGSVITQ